VRTGLSVDFRTFCLVPLRGRGAVYDGRTGTQTGFLCGGPSRGQGPKPSHPTSILGGLGRTRLRCRDVPSSPSSGPVYSGPSIGSILAPMYYYVVRYHGQKVVRTRFLAGVLARVARSVRPGPPRYRSVKAAIAMLFTTAPCYYPSDSRSTQSRNGLLFESASFDRLILLVKNLSFNTERIPPFTAGVNGVGVGTFLPVRPVCTSNRGGMTAPMSGQSDNFGIPARLSQVSPAGEAQDTEATHQGPSESPTG